MISKTILEKTKKRDLVLKFIAEEGPVISKKVHTFAKEYMTDRNVGFILKKLVEDGKIIKVPNLLFMTTSIYSTTKIFHQMKEESQDKGGNVS